MPGMLQQAQQALQASKQQPAPQAPMPQQGQAPMPQQGQAPMPQQGQAPMPQQGQEQSDDLEPRHIPSGAVGATDAPDLSDITQQASPGEQKEYERVMGALNTILYKDDKMSASIVDQLHPSDKIGSVSKAGMMLINQLDEKLDLDEAVIAEVTSEVVDRLIELGETAYGPEMEFSNKEAQAVLGATWEGVMGMFGVDEADYNQLKNNIGDKHLTDLQKVYEGALNG